MLSRRKLAAALAGGAALAVASCKSQASVASDPMIVVNRKVSVRLSQISHVELVEWVGRDDPHYNCWLNIFLKGYEADDPKNLRIAKSDFLVQTELKYALSGMEPTDRSKCPDPEYPIDPLELKDRIERLMANS